MIKQQFVPIVAIILLASCSAVRDSSFRKQYNDVNTLLYESDQAADGLFLKAHMKNGDVMILTDHWSIDTIGNMVQGNGSRYDFNRNKLTEGSLSIPVDSVLLFETNGIPQNNDAQRTTAFTLLAAADVILGTFCLTVPKACFGSCPTFYLDGESDIHHADAEAFSNAVAPGLEYLDIDALNHTLDSKERFTLTMKNEAFETHSVRNIHLLAARHQPGQRVYHSADDRFYVSEGEYPCKAAVADEADISHLIQQNDQIEYFSLSDSSNMKSRERIYLQFDMPQQAKQLGIVGGFRQSLMTTYLIYHALDCMGSQVGDILAGAGQNNDMENTIGASIQRELGGIDVYVWDEIKSDWSYQGQWYETGPIAINHQIMVFDQQVYGDEVKVMLEMNRGLWRLDYLSLAAIVEEVEPEWIQPDCLTYNHQDSPFLLETLNDPDAFLVSQPGDIYGLSFTLPDADEQYDLFLAAKGFYLIWMREEWLQEKDLYSLYQMLKMPGRFLKRHANAYKQYEEAMEEAFWNSRVNQQIISRNAQ